MEIDISCPKSPQDFLNEFDYIDKALKFSPYEDGDTGDEISDSELQSLIDPVLLAEGQKFLRKYTHSIILGTLFSTGTGGVSFKCLLGTLMRTGQVFKFKRQVRAIVIFIKWIKNLDKFGTKLESIQMVRKIHAQVAKTMRNPETKPALPNLDIKISDREKHFLSGLQKDLTSQFQPRIPVPKDTIMNFDPPLHFSQLDMILVQLTTFGYLIGFPEKLGISGKDSHSKSLGFRGFILLAGIISKCLGMDDKWNVCLWKHPSLDPTLVFQRLWYDLTIPCFSQLDEYLYSTVAQASKSYTNPWFSPIHQHQIIYIFIKYGFELKAPEIWRHLTRRDKFIVYLGFKALNSNRKRKFARKFYNNIAKFGITVLSRIFDISV